jgi:hypothetical protein
MERTRRWDRRILMLAATVAVLLASVGIAAATIPGPGGLISGCVKPTGALKVIDAQTSHCGANDKPLTWNQTGPEGPAGAAGPAGPAGAQ